jgi:hypothetical protein
VPIAVALDPRRRRDGPTPTFELVVTAIVLAVVVATVLVFLLVYNDFPLRVS